MGSELKRGADWTDLFSRGHPTFCSVHRPCRADWKHQGCREEARIAVAHYPHHIVQLRHSCRVVLVTDRDRTAYLDSSRELREERWELTAYAPPTLAPMQRAASSSTARAVSTFIARADMVWTGVAAPHPTCARSGCRGTSRDSGLSDPEASRIRTVDRARRRRDRRRPLLRRRAVVPRPNRSRLVVQGVRAVPSFAGGHAI